MKLTFLLGQESKASAVVPDYFKHFAYDFGPFDDAVYRDIDALERLGLVSTRSPDSAGAAVWHFSPTMAHQVDAVYRLTPRGKKYAEALMRAEQSDSGLIRDLKRIVEEYGQLSHDELLLYVYENYPEYTTKSIIRDQVMEENGSRKKR